MKPWSISTTLRNPDRMRNFLATLQELQGKVWDTKTQKEYQIRLIKNRYYGFGSPQFYQGGLTQKQITLIKDINTEITLKEATEIFDNKGFIDPAMRGRQSFNVLKKLGFAQLDSRGKIKITSLGLELLKSEADLERIFLNSFIYWQYPNPISIGFSKKQGFNIRPFIGTLRLLLEVNKLMVEKGMKPVGISREEFRLFVPTLIDIRKINATALTIVEYRNELKSKRKIKDFKEKYLNSYISKFISSTDPKKIEKMRENLKDYADNTIRYFRLTSFVYIRGSGYYVDIEKRRQLEIQKLLEKFDGSAFNYPSELEYLKLLSNYQNIFPWETKSELIIIIDNLTQDIQKTQKIMSTKYNHVIDLEVFEDTAEKSEKQLANYTKLLRNVRRELYNELTELQAREIDNIIEYINKLTNIRSLYRPSLELEKYVTLGLKAINDDEIIRPNYPIGDDNEPTFTAPSNKADIETFYSSYNGICEVTMLTNLTQWYKEGQPVMRHLNDFDIANPDLVSYCLFIAPYIHADTLEEYWRSIKYGYKGTLQKIIPITILQFVKILEKQLELRQKGSRITHIKLQELYDQIVDLTNSVGNSDLWSIEIASTLETWLSANT